MYKHVFIGILLIGFLQGCTSHREPSISVTPRPVRVVQVKALGTITRQYTGIVQATEFSVLAFKVSGSLIELNTEEGQKVKAGELIARIDPYNYQLQFQTAQGNYKAAKSIYERNQRLLKANATAVQNLEIAQADYIRSTSALNMAHLTLEYTHLFAPFNGIIEKQYVKNFEEVMVGQSIVRLVNPKDIEISFILPETNIQLLQYPKIIYIEFDSQKGKLFTSDIKEYIYSSNGSGIPVTLKITDKEFEPYRQNVFPGFSCKVIFEIENTVSDNFFIPSSALFSENGLEYVWTINPSTHTTQRQEVEIMRFDDQALVTRGLNSADYIITAGVQAVRDGQKVSISN